MTLQEQPLAVTSGLGGLQLEKEIWILWKCRQAPDSDGAIVLTKQSNYLLAEM